jgi:drug/metabolite transporter (DMT)-like permease
MNNTTKGIYLAIATAVISGIAIFVNKFAVTVITPPLVFTTVKNLGVGMLILAILLVTKKLKLIKKLNKREWTYLIAIGIIGGSIPFYLFFTGLAQVPAANAAIINKTLIIWVAMLAIPLLKERISPLQIFAVILLFAANLFVGGFMGFTFLDGEFLILIATILWAIENVLAKKILPTVDPDILTAARMGFGSIILLIASFVMAPVALGKVLALNITQIFFVALSMIILLAYVSTWYRALKYAPATTVTSILVASTLVTNALSAIFITHKLDSFSLIQSLMVITGVAIFWLAAKKEVIVNKKNLAA